MATLSDLAVLILAELQRPEAQQQTRYQIMIKVNQKIHPLLSPYSPGAVYHEISKLTNSGMVKIDHSKVSVSHSGIEALHAHLLNFEPPMPMCHLLVTMLAILQLSDSSIRARARKKLLLYMIKSDHTQKRANPEYLSAPLALEKWRSDISDLAKEAILRLLSYL